MDNVHYARILKDVALLQHIKGENRFKIRAFEHASRAILALSEQIEDLIDGDKLSSIDGVGASIAKDIIEIQSTGTCAVRTSLLQELDPGLLQLLRIQGLGPKKVKRLYDELGISTLDMLREAIDAKKIRELSGFGAKTEEKLLVEIERMERSAGRMPLPMARKIADDMHARLSKLPGVIQVEIAGSLRRGRETTGDLDLLVASLKPAPIMEAVVSFPGVEEIIVHGEKKTSVHLIQGIQMDVRVVDPAVFGSALHYFTGSKEHHVKLRTRAKRAGLKISEYGVFRNGEEEPIAKTTEVDVYAALNLPYIPPELREGFDEIDVAESQNIPLLLQAQDVRGDLHMHTTYSDGASSILEMAQAAKARGYEYIVITDHSGSLRVANGMDAKRFAAQIKDIEKINTTLHNFRVLSGIEVDIMRNGSLDMDDDLLRTCDWVIGSVHQHMNLDKEEMTQRLLTAIDTGLISSLGHPTGRILGGRDGYNYDLDAILIACRDKRVAVEINGSGGRLDFNAKTARHARALGVQVVLGSDAHSIPGLDSMKFAVQQARRGWLTAHDVLNTKSADDLIASVR